MTLRREAIRVATTKYSRCESDDQEVQIEVDRPLEREEMELGFILDRLTNLEQRKLERLCLISACALG